jgi:hypothetical protein
MPRSAPSSKATIESVRTFPTSSRPALRAAACGGRPRAGNDTTVTVEPDLAFSYLEPTHPRHSRSYSSDGRVVSVGARGVAKVAPVTAPSPIVAAARCCAPRHNCEQLNSARIQFDPEVKDRSNLLFLPNSASCRDPIHDSKSHFVLCVRIINK